ncbi:Uncharacterized protein SCF082_LOCUS298 [Durusdinium trenchii]|uniref:Transmembrane protein n=1 Tax=Durusdinium trenchii TaxID=1381693 RepID=A0ABP0H9E6_9DINO
MGQSVGRVLCGPSCFTVHTGDVVEKVDSKRVAVEHAERGESARMLLRPEAQAPASSSRQSRVHYAQVDSSPNSRSTATGEGCSRWSPVVFLCFCMTLTMVLVLSINQAMHRSQLTPQNFDCEAGLAVWEVDWSGEKMDFCCVRYGVGCMNFNCEGQDSEWTDLQSRWCCEVRGLGGSCELSLPYDCTNGLDEWHTWQPLKQEWRGALAADGAWAYCCSADIGGLGGNSGRRA